MTKLLLSVAILPFVAGVALAAQPLTDNQMDKVTAGHELTLIETTDVSIVGIRVNVAPTPTTALPPGTYLNVVLPLTSLQVYSAIIGP